MKGTSLEIIQKGEFSFDCTQSPSIKKQSAKLIRIFAGHRHCLSCIVTNLTPNSNWFHAKLSLCPENLSLALAYFSLFTLETHLVPIFILLGHTWSWSERKEHRNSFQGHEKFSLTFHAFLGQTFCLQDTEGCGRNPNLTFVHERRTISTSPRRSF